MNCCPEYFSKFKYIIFKHIAIFTNININKKKSTDKVEPEIIEKQPSKNDLERNKVKDTEWDII